MPRSSIFDRIRRRGRITMACGLAAFDRLAASLFRVTDFDPSVRLLEEDGENWVGGTITSNGVPADRLRLDSAMRKLDQQLILIANLRKDLESHRRDCMVFAGEAGQDIKKANVELLAAAEKFHAAEKQEVANAECHNALVEEVEELRTRLGEIEDRFACRTNVLGQPSQN